MQKLTLPKKIIKFIPICKLIVALLFGAIFAIIVVTTTGLFISLTQQEFDIAVYLSWIVWIVGLHRVNYKG